RLARATAAAASASWSPVAAIADPATRRSTPAAARSAPRPAAAPQNHRRFDSKNGSAFGADDVHRAILFSAVRECRASSVLRRADTRLDTILAAIDDVHGTGQRLRIALHLRGQLAHLRGMREAPALGGHHSDTQRHQRHAVQLSTPVLAEKISRVPILLRVLVRRK